MLDYDQLISHLKGKNTSVDVSVNSLSNEKFLKNRKNILAIIDAIKRCLKTSPRNWTCTNMLVSGILSILLIMLLKIVEKLRKTI